MSEERNVTASRVINIDSVASYEAVVRLADSTRTAYLYVVHIRTERFRNENENYDYHSGVFVADWQYGCQMLFDKNLPT